MSKVVESRKPSRFALVEEKKNKAYTDLNKSLWTVGDYKKLKLQAVLAPADDVRRLVTPPETCWCPRHLKDTASDECPWSVLLSVLLMNILWSVLCSVLLMGHFVGWVLWSAWVTFFNTKRSSKCLLKKRKQTKEKQIKEKWTEKKISTKSNPPTHKHFFRIFRRVGPSV